MRSMYSGMFVRCQFAAALDNIAVVREPYLGVSVSRRFESKSASECRLSGSRKRQLAEVLF